MSGRERIHAALAHEESDCVPVFDVVNNPDIYQAVLGAGNPWAEGPMAVRLARSLGLDAVMVHAGCYTGLISAADDWVGKDFFIDRFGTGFRVMETSWPLGMATKECVLDEGFAQRFARAARVTDADLKPIREGAALAHAPEVGIALFAGIRSAFSQLYISGGLAGLSMLIYEDPVLLRQLVELSTDFWTRVGLEAIGAGADALYVANDMGMNGSTLISPEHLREFFLPALQKQCAAWKKAGGRVILHSCGNIEAILPDLAAMDIDGLNNLQSRAGMDIGKVKRRYGRQWTLVGNVDATEVMTSSDPRDIGMAVIRVLQEAASGGGLILATDHSFHQGIPLENVRTFIDCARNYGRLPLDLPDCGPEGCLS